MNWVRRGRAAWHLIASRDATTTVLRCTGATIPTQGTHISSRRPGPHSRCAECDRIRLELGNAPAARRAWGARTFARIRQGFVTPAFEEP